MDFNKKMELELELEKYKQALETQHNPFLIDILLFEIACVEKELRCFDVR